MKRYTSPQLQKKFLESLQGLVNIIERNQERYQTLTYLQRVYADEEAMKQGKKSAHAVSPKQWELTAHHLSKESGLCFASCQKLLRLSRQGTPEEVRFTPHTLRTFLNSLVVVALRFSVSQLPEDQMPQFCHAEKASVQLTVEEIAQRTAEILYWMEWFG